MFYKYPWQEKQWQLLLSEHRQQRLPQALILQGNTGLGKLDFAKTFSAYVLCENALAESQACGRCRSCELFKANSHPDFYCVQPEEKSKSIRVDQLRDLIHKLGQTSQRDGHQVAVIHPAETMNRAAANALLKTLEEPSGQVLIMLVCDRTNTLPATILSRCQRVSFIPNSDASTLDWLRTNVASDVDPSLLLRLADYAPLQAAKLIEADYFSMRDDVLRHLLQIQKGEADPIAPVAAFMKQDLGLLLHALMTLVMDLSRLALGVSRDQLFHADRAIQLKTLSQKCQAGALQDYFMACLRMQAALQSSIHLNPQMLLEDLLIAFNNTILDKPR